MRYIRHIARAMADFLMPRPCIVCQRALGMHEDVICLHCMSDLPETHFHLVKQNPMADRLNEGIQKILDKKNFYNKKEFYNYAASLFYFSETNDYRHIPYQIKYSHNVQAGRYFGKMLGQKIRKADHFNDIDIIIPVPLHWKRKFKRGYNQAEIIAQGVSESLNIPIDTSILKRRKNTHTQVTLEHEEKILNVRDAFLCRKGREYRHILLIDDVFTTGATALACFKALREVFPPSVRISVATLAFVGEG